MDMVLEKLFGGLSHKSKRGERLFMALVKGGCVGEVLDAILDTERESLGADVEILASYIAREMHKAGLADSAGESLAHDWAPVPVLVLDRAEAAAAADGADGFADGTVIRTAKRRGLTFMSRRRGRDFEAGVKLPETAGDAAGQVFRLA
jgi:hypothetical protein